MPDTLQPGEAHYGQPLQVGAIAVVGTIRSGEADVYSFVGRAGDVLNVELISAALRPFRGQPFDGVLKLFDAAGNLIATNDDELEGSRDAVLLDVPLAADGVYYVEVSPFFAEFGGRYELFLTRFRLGGDPAANPGDVLVGGAGSDELVGGAADDIFRAAAAPGDSDRYDGRSGFDVLDATGAAATPVTGSIERLVDTEAEPVIDGAVDPISTVAGQPVTFTVSASDPDDRLTFRLAPIAGQTFTPGAVIDPFSGTFRWLPLRAGEYAAEVVVTDATGRTATQTVFFHVANVAPAIQAGGDANLTEGVTLARRVTFADPGADVWSAAVDYGDGSGPQVVTVAGDRSFALNHAYADSGEYTVTVTVSDGLANATSSLTVHAANTAPYAVSASGTTVPEGSSASVQVIGATDVSPADAASLRYSYDFDGDGTFDLGDGTYSGSVESANAAVPVEFLAGGSAVRAVRIRVIDRDEGYADLTADVTVENAAPTADPTATGTLLAGDPIALDANADDAGNDIVSIVWTVASEDGSAVATGTGPTFGFTPTTAGVHTVLLKVVDADGATSVTALELAVAKGSKPTARVVGESVLEWAGAARVRVFPTNATPEEAAALRYSYDFGDDGTFDLGDGSYAGSVADTAVAVPAVVGSVAVRVRVLNAAGEFIDYRTAVSLTNVPPSLELTSYPNGTQQGQVFAIEGYATDPGGPLTGTIDFGDGTGPRPLDIGEDGSFRIEHDYATVGARTVTVTVSDGTVAVSRSFPVADFGDAYPQFDLELPEEAAEGDAVTVRAIPASLRGPNYAASLRYSYDFDGDGSWDVGDGTYAGSVSSNSAEIPPGFLNGPRWYYVSVLAIDRDGDRWNNTGELWVKDVPPAVAPIRPIVLSAADLTISGTGSFVDPGAESGWVVYIFYGDGSFEGVAANPDRTFAFAHTYAELGVYTVRVVVEDRRGEGSGETEFLVGPPGVAVNSGPADEGDTVTVAFDTADADPALTADWHFAYYWVEGDEWLHGDGTYVGSDGTRELELPDSLTGDGYREAEIRIVGIAPDGTTYETSTVVVVYDVAPVVTVPAGVVLSNLNPTLDLRLPITDPGDEGLWSVTVNYGDGYGDAFTVEDDGSSLVSLWHSYSGQGTYTVTVYVWGGDEDLLGSAQFTVGVIEQVDIGVLSADPVLEGGIGRLTFTPFDPAAELLYSYDFDLDGVWDLEDVADGTVEVPAALTADGWATVPVTVRVTDPSGARTYYTTDLEVEDVSPVLEPVADVTLTDLDPTLTFTTRFADPGAEPGGWRAYVDFGEMNPSDPDGGNFWAEQPVLAGQPFTFEHTYAAPGSYLVYLEVYDDAGQGYGWSAFTVDVETFVPEAELVADAVAEGELATVTLNPTNVPAAELAGVRYAFDLDDDGLYDDGFGDGTYDGSLTHNSITLPADRTADGPASIPVIGRILFRTGTESRYAGSVEVRNAPPTVAADAPEVVVDEGQEATMTGTWSDPGGDVVLVSASIGTVVTNADGTWVWWGDFGSSQWVWITAEDEDGGQSSTGFFLTLNNLPPDVAADSEFVGVGEGQMATMTGTWSDPGNDVVTLTTVSGTVVQNADGTWAWFFDTAGGPDDGFGGTVTITATDDDGAQSSATFDLFMYNLPPTVVAAASSASAYEGQTATMTGNWSDPGGDAVALSASVGTVARNADGTWTWTLAGGSSQTVTITATDEDGASSSASFDLVVVNPPPLVTAVASSVAVSEGQTAFMTGTWSDPGGDGVTLTASAGTITRNADGTWSWSLVTADGPGDGRTVTITATDGGGGSSSVSFVLTVDNLPPSAGVSGPATTTAGQPVTFTLTATDPAVADRSSFTLRIDWDGDGTVDQTVTGASGTTVSRTFATAGTYNVRVTATDKDGGVSPAATHGVQVTSTGGAPGTAVLVGGDLVVTGTSGNDVIRVSAGTAAGSVVVRINGTQFGPFVPSGLLLIQGLSGNDDIEVAREVTRRAEIDGGAGNDRLVGGGGNDRLVGGAGNDELRARVGDDRLEGEDGNDSLYAGDGRDLLLGGNGNDVLRGGAGADTLDGGTGNDELYGGQSTDALLGGDGNDYLQAGLSGDVVDGGAGNDTLSGGLGADLLIGGTGNDLLLGGLGDDELIGGDGNDELNGGLGDDVLSGGTGNDTLNGDIGADILDGGTGNDELNGGSGDDILVGGDGNDKLVGSLGGDLLIGGKGADDLSGGAGEDLLIAGWTLFDGDRQALLAIRREWTSGDTYTVRIYHLTNGGGLNGTVVLTVATVRDDAAADRLDGGLGRDWFLYDWDGPGSTRDIVVDLSSGEKRLDID